MNWTRSRFEMEGLGTYEGFHQGDDWNGWACPVFEFEEAERLASDYRKQADDYPGEYIGRYDPATHRFRPRRWLPAVPELVLPSTVCPQRRSHQSMTPTCPVHDVPF